MKVEIASNGVKSLTEVEVVAKAERRRFTAQYKQKVLREADHCKQPGEIGGLLRGRDCTGRIWRIGASSASAGSWLGCQQRSAVLSGGRKAR